MHVSSQATMRRCLKRHLLTDPILSLRTPLRVLDVGGADYNGSYRGMFERLGASYTAADISQGVGVDVVMPRADRLPFEDGSFDVVISCQTFEHCWNFWMLFADMVGAEQPRKGTFRCRRGGEFGGQEITKQGRLGARSGLDPAPAAK